VLISGRPEISEKGRDEGPPLIVAMLRSRCALLLRRQALIRRSAPPSPIREKGRAVAVVAKGEGNPSPASKSAVADFDTLRADLGQARDQ